MASRLLSCNKLYCTSLSKLASNNNRIISSSVCNFSTTNTEAHGSGGDNTTNTPPPQPKKKHPQSFVQPDINLELGELETEIPPNWYTDSGKGRGKYRHDNDGRSSYWRPPFKNARAEIISAEDFAKRPRVTFSESFLSMNDAMVVETWMSQQEKDQMYELYVNMMTSIAAQQKSSNNKPSTEEKDDFTDKNWNLLSTNTSHEYVIRVVAQNHNVTTSRAAGVIQLQHNEEQLKKDPNFKVNYALQEHMDNKIREHIRETYKSYGETDPLTFTEDPIAATGKIGREDTGSDNVVTASELTDVDALLKKTKLQEIEKAEVRIANHVYIEDVDERTRKVQIDKEARRLMKSKEEFKKESVKQEGKKKSNKHMLKIPKGATPFPNNNRGHNETPDTRRPRWKFAAQIINEHMLENPTNSSRRGKKVAARAKARRHGRIVEGNTIIEQDGNIRAASVAELEQTSWKHVRNESEFMFKGVKDAWMRRQLEGEVGGWGVQEEVFKVEEIEAKEEEAKDGEDGDGEGAAEGEEAITDDKEDGTDDK